MRVLVITSSFPRGPGDIAGRFVEEWCREMRRMGHECDVLTWASPRDPRALSAPVLARVRYGPTGFQTLFYGAGAPENLEERPGRVLWALPAMAAMYARAMWALRVGCYDLVVGHWLVPGGLVARLVSAAAGVPSLVVGHSGGVHALGALPRWVGRPLARWITSGPTTVSSEALALKLRRMSASASAEVLPMGFDAAEVSEDRNSGRDWLYMGRLVEIKGVALAIEAFSRAGLGDEVTLRVAGDGPERGSLKALAERLGARVTFEGVVRGERKRALLARCGFGVFPSRDDHPGGRTEGMPVSVLEAMAAGVLPLVSGMPGVKKLVADPDVQWLEDRRPEAWARRMRELARLPEHERASWARAGRRAVDAYAWSALRQKWDAALRRAAPREGQPCSAAVPSP